MPVAPFAMMKPTYVKGHLLVFFFISSKLKYYPLISFTTAKEAGSGFLHTLL